MPFKMSVKCRIKAVSLFDEYRNVRVSQHQVNTMVDYSHCIRHNRKSDGAYDQDKEVLGDRHYFTVRVGENDANDGNDA